MTRIKNRDITDRFIEAFENDKPYTPSEKRMMGIKLSQLKKNIKAHIESTGRQTDLSVEQIIMDTIEYSVMTRKPFRSIASLGFEVLDQSLDYWEKRRKLEEFKTESLVKPFDNSLPENDFYNHDNSVNRKQVINNSHDKPNNSPAWMNNNEW